MTDSRFTADERARHAQGRDRAARNPAITNLGPISDMPGWTAHVVGGRGGVLVVLPTLLPGAPASLQRRVRDRILTNATGRCPRCGEVAQEPEKAPGGGMGTEGLAHADDCRVLITPADVRWFDPRSGLS